jgi:hypothetical protein
MATSCEKRVERMAKESDEGISTRPLGQTELFELDSRDLSRLADDQRGWGVDGLGEDCSKEAGRKESALGRTKVS